ncbi:MAG TPA: toll/interleukin-1 receptor domain-containing protein [Thermoanaerobaculia bacterium]
MKTVVSSLWKYIRRYRFRYDIFISYARADGSSYAKQLRERLKQLDFTAFLDETEITPGDPLRHSLRGALERSATLVIVGTPSAAKSLYIALEVGHFAATGRRIIPINVGGSITDAPWDAVRANELVWIDDAPEAFAHGSPGLSVAADIERFFEYRKRNSIQRLRTIGVALLFAVVTIASVFVIWRQIGNLRDEQQKSTRQEVEANLARALSRKKEREAQTQTRIAAAQTQIAADNRRTADERLIETTQEQGRYELLRGNRQQALISLAQVYHERPNDHIVKALVASAAQGIVREVAMGAGPLTDACWTANGERILTVTDKEAKAGGAADLWDRQGHHIVTLRHKGTLIRKAVFAGHDHLIVSTNELGMSVWGSDGQWKRDIGGIAKEKVWSFLLTTDEKRIFVSCEPTETSRTPSDYLIDFESGDIVRRFQPGESLILSGSGKVGGTLDATGKIRLFQPIDGADIVMLADRHYSYAALSPDGTQIAFALPSALAHDPSTYAPPGRVVVRNLISGQESEVALEGVDSNGAGFDLTFNQDGTQIAVTLTPFRFVVWRRGGSYWESGVGQAVSGNGPMFSPDGQRIAASGIDKINLYDAESFELLDSLHEPDLNLVRYNTSLVPVTSHGAQFNAAGTELLMWNTRGVRILDAARDGRIATRSTSTTEHSVALSRNGRWLLTIAGGVANLVDVMTGRIQHSVQYGIPGGSVNSAGLSDNGKYGVLVDNVAYLVDFDRSTAKEIAHGSFSVAISDNGEWLALADPSNIDSPGVEVRARRGGASHRISGAPESVRFAPGGSLIMLFDTQGEILVHDPNSKRDLKRVGGCAATISPDGQWAAILNCAPENGLAPADPIRLVSLRTGVERVLISHDIFRKGLGDRQIVFSDDGHLLATATAGGPIRLWTVPEGELLHTLATDHLLSAEESLSIEGLDFDSSGERLAAVDKSGVKVWDVRRGAPISILGGPYAPVMNTIRFVEEGDYVAGFTAPYSSIPGVMTLWMSKREKRPPDEIDRLVTRIPLNVRASVDASLKARLHP